MPGAGFDAKVEKVTKNVIDDLYVARPGAGGRAAWTLPARVYPPAAWEQTSTFGEAVLAITAIEQGQLLAQGAATFALDAERSTTALPAPTVVAKTALKSYGADIWATYIFGGTSDGRVHTLLGGIYSSQSWNQNIGPFFLLNTGMPTGIAAVNSSPFVMMLGPDGKTTTLYKVFNDVTAGTWRKLGAVYPPIRAITTGFDGMFFGVRDGGPPRVAGSNQNDELDLYCREASNVDLTWTKIGTVPARTYALATYYGRLYALQAEATGSPTGTTMFWRVALADAAFPYRAPSMLFLDGATFAIGFLTTGGDFATTGQGTLDFSYTHVSRANDGLVFFYNRPTQSGVIVRFAANGTYAKLKVFGTNAFGQWDLLAYVRCGERIWGNYQDVSPMKDKLVFYGNSGVTSIGAFDTVTGDYTQSAAPTFPASLTHVVCTWAGDLLLYRRSTGACQWGRVNGTTGAYVLTNSGTLAANLDQIVPAGNTYLFFYQNVASAGANAWLDPLHDTLTNVSGVSIGTGRKLASCQNGLVMDYAAGAAKMYGFSADPNATAASATPTSGGFYYDDVNNHGIILRSYGAVFSTGWQVILGLGIL